MGLFGSIGDFLDKAADGIATAATKVGQFLVPGPKTVIGTGPSAPAKSAVPFEPEAPHRVIHHMGKKTSEKDDSEAGPIVGERYDPTGRPIVGERYDPGGHPVSPPVYDPAGVMPPPVIPTFPEDCGELQGEGPFGGGYDGAPVTGPPVIPTFPEDREGSGGGPDFGGSELFGGGYDGAPVTGPPVIPTFPEDRGGQAWEPVQDDAGAEPFGGKDDTGADPFQRDDASGAEPTGTTGRSNDGAATGRPDGGGSDQGYERSGFDSPEYESAQSQGDDDVAHLQ